MRKTGKRIAGLAGFAIALLLSGCLVDIDFDGDSDGDRNRIRGSGIEATTVRSVAGFNEVSISGVGRLLIEPGDVESLTITADDNILTYLQSEVEGGRLILGPEDGLEFEQIREIVYRLTVRNLDAIQASGVVKVIGRNVVSDAFVANVSGVSSIDLTGEAPLLDVFVSGVSNFWGRDFLTVDTHVVSSGVAYVEVNVRDRLDVKASGVSTIRYLGHPFVSADVSGASTVGPLF